MMNVADIRKQFLQLKVDGHYVADKTGCRMLEIIGATFDADEESIFGTVNHDYVKREIEWYESMSLNVNDISGDTPKQWLAVATKEGLINSNYGYLIWHDDNYRQYDNVLAELKKNPFSRRAVMVYTRPSIWNEYNKDGMSDFICTNAVQYMIRDGKLNTVVQFRSNDVVFGYKNDRAWNYHVQQKLAADLNVPVGRLIWCAGSLHVYERHFDLIK